MVIINSKIYSIHFLFYIYSRMLLKTYNILFYYTSNADRKGEVGDRRREAGVRGENISFRRKKKTGLYQL